MRKFLLQTSFVTMSLCPLFSKAQTQPAAIIDHINQRFEQYTRDNYRQQLYIQTDKTTYLAGETIWMKLYCSILAFGDVPDMSKIVYVEVLNEKNQPVLQQKLGIHEGLGEGFLTLLPTMETGNYTLCAYTKWMQNFGEEYFFKQPVTIINTFEQLSLVDSKQSKKAIIKFATNGGQLVAGVKNFVAYSIKDPAGNGLEASGKIVDNAGNFVTDIKPGKFGIDSFSFTPQSNKKYKALIHFNQQDTIVALPEVKDQGYVVTYSMKDHFTIMVETSMPVGQTYYSTVVQNNGKITAVDVAPVIPDATNPKNHKIHFYFKGKNPIREGVNEITVFDNEYNIVGQRLFFQPPTAKLNITTKVNKSIYGKREKVDIDVATKDSSDQTVPANLSVKVIRKDQLDLNKVDDIQSYHMLTSHINGIVEEPAYYFAGSNNVVEDANMLLLLQGKYSVDWSAVFNTKQPKFLYAPELNGHIVTGKVTNKRTGKPMPNTMVYLSIPGKQVRFFATTSDDNGYISVEVPGYYGDGDLVVQPAPQDSAAQIAINSPYYVHKEQPIFHTTQDVILTKAAVNDLKQRHREMQIQQAFFGDSLTLLAYKGPTDSAAFYGPPDEQFNLDDYTRFRTMEEVFREYVPTVMVRKHSDGLHLLALDKGLNSPKFFDRDPFILLDGVPIFNNKKFFEYDPLKVRKGSVVAHQYIYNNLKVDGIVSLQTYKGDLDGYQLEPYVTVQEYNGLQYPRAFYSPQYDGRSRNNRRMPDYRNLLYWSPNVKIGNDGNGKVNFYTCDIPGEYLIVVEGISTNGQVGYTYTDFKVE
ncbi:hypothetical protein LX64_02150 [Chitinophaga skermanii]|uniref:MG2 domain-containing protein n=1 Tax=Chitinophaga skermanii TaxID=331697 RepID=A0A327QRW4_9BACT|nr:hypothetical protein [Chitinophaga skermanii]RAJ07021.1 hypothetical protein LX64_02150 [Chitinophaga skermanii]